MSKQAAVRRDEEGGGRRRRGLSCYIFGQRPPRCRRRRCRAQEKAFTYCGSLSLSISRPRPSSPSPSSAAEASQCFSLTTTPDYSVAQRKEGREEEGPTERRRLACVRPARLIQLHQRTIARPALAAASLSIRPRPVSVRPSASSADAADAAADVECRSTSRLTKAPARARLPDAARPRPPRM